VVVRGSLSKKKKTEERRAHKGQKDKRGMTSLGPWQTEKKEPPVKETKKEKNQKKKKKKPKKHQKKKKKKKKTHWGDCDVSNAAEGREGFILGGEVSDVLFTRVTHLVHIGKIRVDGKGLGCFTDAKISTYRNREWGQSKLPGPKRGENRAVRRTGLRLGQKKNDFLMQKTWESVAKFLFHKRFVGACKEYTTAT